MTNFDAVYQQLLGQSRVVIESDTFKDWAIHVINPNYAPNSPNAVYNDGSVNIKVTEHLDGSTQNQDGYIHEVRAQDNTALYIEGDWTGYAWINRSGNWITDVNQADQYCGILVGCKPQIDSGHVSQHDLHNKNTNTGHFTVVESSDHKGVRGYNDLFYGGSGNDFMDGKTGTDELHGGGGNDIINGGIGNDMLYGDSGTDFLFGEDGNDVMYGGTGDDYLDGGNNDDTIDGQDGDDALYGGAGDDILTGGPGSDSIFGGADNDTYMFTLGSGIDYAVEANGEGTMDTAYIVDTVDLAVIKLGNDLILAPNDNDMLVLSNWYVNQQGIDYVYIADADEIYTAAQIASLATDLTSVNGIQTMDLASFTGIPQADFSGLEPVSVETVGIGDLLDAAAASLVA